MPTALIIVDIQRDFCAGGSLAVGDADSVVPIINHLRTTLAPDLVALTQDWHPADHTSFITNNPGERLFETRRHDGQMMWPVHCVQDSEGASWHKDLQTLSSDAIVRKGTKQAVDSYSGFGSQDKVGERTQLEPILRAAGITEVVVVGLAFDYCVAATAKDAAALGFRTTLVRGASRAVAVESAAVAETELKAAGVTVLESYPPTVSTTAPPPHSYFDVGDHLASASALVEALVAEWFVHKPEDPIDHALSVLHHGRDKDFGCEHTRTQMGEYLSPDSTEYCKRYCLIALLNELVVALKNDCPDDLRAYTLAWLRENKKGFLLRYQPIGYAALLEKKKVGGAVTC